MILKGKYLVATLALCQITQYLGLAQQTNLNQ
jgi:hypothetical protein